jgi:hypothetical protein
MKMKGTVLIILALFIFQSALMVILWKPASVPQRELTPIPILIPATMGAPVQRDPQTQFGKAQCSIAALDLIGSWVKAGKPEQKPFSFEDNNKKSCIGSFTEEIQPLFNQPNLWFSGAIACSSCHNNTLKSAAARMSLVSYNDILAGSGRGESTQNGKDILGDKTTWEESKLYKMIISGMMPVGRPSKSPPTGPILRVGALTQ